MAEEKAYVGYRSAGRRPEGRQDRRAAADAPLSALRGAVSGVLGAPGDIESLIRMLPGLSERTVLPTSEDVEKRLPLPELNRTPTGRAFTTAGQLGGGFYGGPGSPLRAVAALPSAVSRAGRDFLMSTSPVNVIKPKGGNWLAGSVERAVEPMKVRVRTEGVNGHTAENVFSDESMNRWLEQKLSKYIRNEMGTPEDPIRALAERGVTHAELPERTPSSYLGARREAVGVPAEGMAQSDLARRWEDLSDEAIHNMPARDRVNPDTGWGSTVALRTEKENPWLMKVPPETQTYGVYPVEARQDLGFEHLADELRNAINPESGLPANLQWKYADLDKVTVPQAVQRVADINEWRAAQKAEADLARANNSAAFTHKEYPEQGFKWVELKNPEDFNSRTNSPDEESMESFKRMADMNAFDLLKNNRLGDKTYEQVKEEELQKVISKYWEPEPAVHPSLKEALKYEGDTMGHCVGGYCEDVAGGAARIFSLRDSKGQPHVTIEVDPTGKRVDMTRRRMIEPSEDSGIPGIVQIKGKGNKAPKEDYLPYVQDFVRSGQWGRVGDLENTGLRNVSNWVNPDTAKEYEKFGLSVPKYATDDELDALHRQYESLAKPTPDAEGFASGGLVEYNPAKIQSLVDTLREEMYG